jgi:hypothetical protein
MPCFGNLSLSSDLNTSRRDRLLILVDIKGPQRIENHALWIRIFPPGVISSKNLARIPASSIAEFDNLSCMEFRS